MTWPIPEYDKLLELYTERGRLQAEIELKELERDEIERNVKRGSRKADSIEAAKEASKQAREELAQLRARLYVVNANLDLEMYKKDMYTYRDRKG